MRGKGRSLLQSSNRMRKRSLVVVAVPPRRDALRGTTKQSDNLLKSLEARLLRYALYTMRCRATLAMTCLRVFPTAARGCPMKRLGEARYGA